MFKSSVLAGAVIALAVGCAHQDGNQPPLRTVEHVDVQRYLGTWYEIAAIPQRFEKGCFGSVATYALRDDGMLSVTNRCRKGSLDGPESVANGRARIVDTRTNAKLKVGFWGPFWGDYWIIGLGENYEYAVVGHPNRKYLWILSRLPTMDEALYQDLLTRVAAQGYDVNRIERMPQRSQPAS